jgi:sugar O-acyltransferase (sialic acid O-acetyltransferase NeuD family)
MAERCGGYEIVGLIGDYERKGQIVLRYSVLGAVSELPQIADEHDVRQGVVAIGDNWKRACVVTEIRRQLPDFRFVSVLHPSVSIGLDVTVGTGCVAMPRAVINAASVIGEFVIINTGASVGHDCCVGDFASVGPNATLGGGTVVGAYTAIALGAKVIQGIRIGEQTVVGAGSTVVKDVPAHVVAYGTPAAIIRPRSTGERYL